MTTGLLVGADGRLVEGPAAALRCEAPKPEYVGTSFIETYLYDADRRHPAAAKATGDGSLFAVTTGKGILGHREADAVLHTYVALNKPQEWIAAPNGRLTSLRSSPMGKPPWSRCAQPA